MNLYFTVLPMINASLELMEFFPRVNLSMDLIDLLDEVNFSTEMIDMLLADNVTDEVYVVSVDESGSVEIPYNVSNVFIFCVVYGREEPSVNWTTPPLDDNYINPVSVNMMGLVYVVTSLLNITNFTTDHAGTYQCNASNCAGNMSQGIGITKQGNVENNGQQFNCGGLLIHCMSCSAVHQCAINQLLTSVV